MVAVEMTLSIHVFFLSAAMIPKPIPIGILRIIEYRLTTIVAGSFSMNIPATS